MSDTLGRITIPTPTPSGLTLNPLGPPAILQPDFGYSFTDEAQVISHRFGSGATLQSQRFFVGFGARHFTYRREVLSYADRAYLLNFYEAVQGSFQSFTYNAPSQGTSTTTPYTVIFDSAPLSIQHLSSMCKTGFGMTEIVANPPAYTVSGVDVRFPGSVLTPALLSETQQIVPLIHIKVRDPGVPDLYLSDRRCTVAGFPGAPNNPQLFLPRVLDIGEAGSSVIMSQDISGKSDNLSFTLGNADRAMSLFIRDTSLQFAEIDLCLFHVQSGVLLKLWKGTVIGWQADGSPQFKIQCSDGLWPVMQAYPRRVVSRQCWKTFNDGNFCPFATQGSLVGPGASPTSCDYYFNSSNGCLAHGMSPYFGGHPDFPQSVVIKDNGTGIIGGFFRSTVTSTSIVSDSIWGSALPEIWCNDSVPQTPAPFGDPRLRAFWANALVASVRDESTYEDVLGIVGAGPLSLYEGMGIVTNADGYEYVVAPMADGFPPQGFQVNGNLTLMGSYNPGYGLRETLGSDPAVIDTDFFSLGQGTPQNWFIPDPNFNNILTPGPGTTGHNPAARLTTSAGPGQILPYAAGTAVSELRYRKAPASGIAPTTAESHTMTVPIAQGLPGFAYDPVNPRSTIAGLVNPFWIAANSYWRALGVNPNDQTTQLATIVRDSFVNLTGSGAAQIANTLVAPIIGVDPSGNTVTQETQWQFQGSVGPDLKPFRDWLIEILNCALGYFTFEFGALKVGIRYNAIPTISYTYNSNMLYQSLTLTPAPCQFEDLTISYADRDLQYQQNTAQYSDKDHALYFGRAGSPLASHIRSVGTPTLSQGLRYAATRCREEVGGILRTDLPSTPYVEYDNFKDAVWKTTIMALDTEVGMVVELTHPEITTYPGAPPGFVGGNPALAANTWPFRVRKWTLYKDWSVQISGRSVTDSMYALETGPIVTGVPVNGGTILYYPQPLGVWGPAIVQAISADALYPLEYTFSLSQFYTILKDGTASASATVTGRLPVTGFLAGCGAPQIKSGSVSKSTTGGALTGGQTVYLAVCAGNSLGLSPPSDILAVQIPSGTNTNQIVLSDIQWPLLTGLTNWYLFAYADPNNADPIGDTLVCFQTSGSLTSGGGGGGYTPASITISAPLVRSTWGLPNVNIKAVRLKYKLLLHGGVLGAAVDSAYGSTIVSNECVDSAATDNWAGRVLVIIGRNNTEAPFSAYNIIAFAPSTGTFTLDRAVTGVRPGDAFVVTFKGYDNSATPYVFTDAGISNAANVTQVGTAATNVGVLFSVPSNGATTTIAGKTYTFETTLTNVDGNVLIGASIAATLVNLMAAVNLGSGAGSLYAASMSANPNCTVTATLSPSISFVANLPGSAGNSLTCLGTLGYPVGGLFSGGEDAGSPAPHTGLSVNFESGLVGRIISGFNRGAKANVVSNTATSYTFDSPMLMDTTSVLIIEAATWYPSVDTVVPANLDPTVTFTLPLPVINYEKTTLWVEGVTVDNNSVESSDGDACGRMLYLYGNGGDRPDFGTALVTTTSTQV